MELLNFQNTMITEPWLKHPIILTGQFVDLLPLEKEHFKELYSLASEKRIWEFYPNDCSKQETFERLYNEALVEREKGNRYPFVIFHKSSQKLIGSTRFMDIHPKDKNLEIGFTWLHPNYWARGINFECKLLLLTYCFETLKTIRVQLKTDSTNLRSQKAIEKIGGKFEGILRKDRIRENGTVRNTAFYSILDDEWEDAKQKIKLQLKQSLLIH